MPMVVKIVFEKDYQLWLYDVASKKAEKLKSLSFATALFQRKKILMFAKYYSYDVSPDGKKLAFTSRGEIFVSDVDGKFIQQIAKGSAERAREVKWLSDNKTILFNQTNDGFLNWYTIAADGATPSNC